MKTYLNQVMMEIRADEDSPEPSNDGDMSRFMMTRMIWVMTDVGRQELKFPEYWWEIWANDD